MKIRETFENRKKNGQKALVTYIVSGDYEVNNAFRKELQEKGMNIVGTSPDNRIVEMIEIAGHPFYVGTPPRS